MSGTDAFAGRKEDMLFPGDIGSASLQHIDPMARLLAVRHAGTVMYYCKAQQMISKTFLLVIPSILSSLESLRKTWRRAKTSQKLFFRNAEGTKDFENSRMFLHF